MTSCACVIEHTVECQIKRARRRGTTTHTQAATLRRRYALHRYEAWRSDVYIDRDELLGDIGKRARIRQRDGRTCQYCGVECVVDAPATARFLFTLDHVIPKSRGGHHSSWHNQVVACQACNGRKDNRMPWEVGMWPQNGVRGVWASGQLVIPIEVERRHR